MEYRHVGKSGLTVSTVGLGCVQFGRRPDEAGRSLIDEDQLKETFEAAFDAGVTLFDTSDSYGNGEDVLSKYIKSCRDDIVLATKFGNPVKGAGNDFGARGARRYIRRAVERSLQRLGTDRIDLYQMHSPDPTTPIEETLSVLTDLIHEGKVRYIGSSNFDAWSIVDAEWLARSNGLERFVSIQNHYSLIARKIEEDIIPACQKYGIGVITLRPLGEGLLTGKYHRGEERPADATRNPRAIGDKTFDLLEALETFGRERGISLLDVAISGLAAQPGVASVIAGARSADQIRANVAAAEWKPSPEDLAELDRITLDAQPFPQDPTGVWPNLGLKRAPKVPAA